MMTMIKKKILKEDGRYLIYYSFLRESDLTGDKHHRALTKADKGMIDDVRDAMEPGASAMGCNCNSQAGKNI